MDSRPRSTPLCPVCAKPYNKARYQVDDHYDMRTYCPVCWTIFTRIDSLRRHVARQHSQHTLASMVQSINRSSAFYIAVDPLRWNPDIPFKENSQTQKLLQVVQELYAKSDCHTLPDKQALSCPATSDEACQRCLVVPASHLLDVPATPDGTDGVINSQPEVQSTTSPPAPGPFPLTICVPGQGEVKESVAKMLGANLMSLPEDWTDCPSDAAKYCDSSAVGLGWAVPAAISSLNFMTGDNLQFLDALGNPVDISDVVTRPEQSSSGGDLLEVAGNSLLLEVVGEPTIPVSGRKTVLVASTVPELTNNSSQNCQGDVSTVQKVVQEGPAQLQDKSEVELTLFPSPSTLDELRPFPSPKSKSDFQSSKRKRKPLRVTERKRTETSSAPTALTWGPRKSYIFQLVEIQVLSYHTPCVRPRMACFLLNELVGLYQLDILVDSRSVQVLLKMKPSLPSISKTLHQLIHKSLDHGMEHLKGVGFALLAQFLCQVLGVNSRQIKSCTALLKKNSGEFERMRSYSFLERELPKGEALRSLFHQVRKLNLRRQVTHSGLCRPKGLFGVSSAVESSTTSDRNKNPVDVGAEHSSSICTGAIPKSSDHAQSTATGMIETVSGEVTSLGKPEESSAVAVYVPTATKGSSDHAQSTAPGMIETESDEVTSLGKPEESSAVAAHITTTAKDALSTATGGVESEYVWDITKSCAISAKIGEEKVEPYSPSRPAIVSHTKINTLTEDMIEGQAKKVPRGANAILDAMARCPQPEMEPVIMFTHGSRPDFLEKDRDLDDFTLLLPNGFAGEIRPARRNWELLEDRQLSFPLYPGSTDGLLWPPIQWQDLSAEERTRRFLHFAQVMDMVWYGGRMSRSEHDLAARYYAFLLPGSIAPHRKGFSSQISEEEHFQSYVHLEARRRELFLRRTGRLETLSPLLLADDEATATWRRRSYLQLPKPLLEILDEVPLFRFSWKVPDRDGLKRETEFL